MFFTETLIAIGVQNSCCVMNSRIASVVAKSITESQIIDQLLLFNSVMEYNKLYTP